MKTNNKKGVIIFLAAVLGWVVGIVIFILSPVKSETYTVKDGAIYSEEAAPKGIATIADKEIINRNGSPVFVLEVYYTDPTKKYLFFVPGDVYGRLHIGQKYNHKFN